MTERHDKEQRNPVVEKKADCCLHQAKREIQRITSESKRAAAHERQRRLRRVNVCPGPFHSCERRQRQSRRQNDQDKPADARDTISHDRDPYEQMHQNADHRVYQPDQWRERDDSGVIR